jgi:hypothetical protein
MKKLILISLLVLVSCKTTQQREHFTYSPTEKQVWIDSYKYDVFYGCIKEGAGNDSLRLILQQKDLFNRNVNVDLAISKQARELGAKIIREMPEPIIKIDKGEEYLKDKNFISYNCLVYYASRELDSIAHTEYEKVCQYKEK